MVDNTFATPLLQQPLALGADIVVHSATKFIAGHSDVLIGALVVTRSDELLRRAEEAARPDGQRPGPFEAWLALRGLRTLAVRLDRAEANAQVLVERLRGPPGGRRGPLPGLRGDRVLRAARGPLAADLLSRSTRLWVHATSLGGVESTFERRRRWKSEAATIPEALVRVSVGHRGRRGPVGRPGRPR